jgi:hypothetical protein
MKMKLFATLGLLAAAVSSQAAVVSVNDVTVPVGTSSITVPVLIAPSSAGELVGAMNISFAAGQAGNGISILNTGTEFDGTIWDNGGTFFGAAGTPSTHSVLSAVAMLSPLQISPNGTIVSYTLDTSSLAAGMYVLDPNFQVGGVGTSAGFIDSNNTQQALNLTFDSGLLTVQGQVIPEPSTVVLTSIFAVLGLGLALKRHRG